MSNRSYRLLMTPRSPFARRARLALHRLGVSFSTELVDVFQPTEKFLRESPLGQVPVLVFPSGECLTDSASILEFLHETQGHQIWPLDLQRRLAVRIASTLAEGIMTYTVSHYIESRMKKPSSTEWVQDYRDTLERALGAVARQDPSVWMDPEGLTQAGYDLGVALEYLDLRLPEIQWRDKHPNLHTVLEKCREFQEFRDSTPPPA